MVKFTEQGRQELVCGKVRDHGFVQVLLNRKSGYTEGDRIQIAACVPDIVEKDLAGEPAVLLRLPTDTVCEAFGQGITKNRIKFRGIRQPKP